MSEVNPVAPLDELEQAQSMADQGQFLDAIATLDPLLAKNSSLSSAWKLKGDCLRALRRNAASLDSYDHAIAIAPFEPETWYARGCLFDAMGAYGNAIENYNQAFALSPNPTYQEAKDAIYQQKKLVLAV